MMNFIQKKIYFLLCPFLLLFSLNAFAIQKAFHITVTSYGVGPGNTALPAAVKTEIDNLFASIEDEVNKKLPDVDVSEYLNGMADAGSISTKGLGVDYASSPDVFVVGAGAGLGADVGNNSFSDLTSGKIKSNQLKGVGAQASIMAGINMKIFDFKPKKYFDPNKLTLFVNFGAMKLPKINDVEGKFMNYGFHAQYQFIDEYKVFGRLLRWGGLYFTTGIDHAYFKATFKKNFLLQMIRPITDASLGGTVNMTANYNGYTQAGAETSINTIPLEISTNLQLLYFLTLFGGLGADLNFGTSKALALLSGDVSASDQTSTITGVQAQANLNLGDKGSPTGFTPRWFLGTQLNLYLLKVYVQLNHGIGADTWGVNAGLRIAY